MEAYSVPPDAIAAYLKKADETLVEKEQLLQVQKTELIKVQNEIARVYRLYQDEQLDSESFGRFFKPLEERRKQLEANIPELEAQIDVYKVNNLSAQEVAAEAHSLSKQWPTFEPQDKRNIVESLVEKITVGKDEIAISFCYLPSCKDMAKGWRKGRDSNPR